ncbi:hypothetical protein KSP40_PGU017504 [Platanthera guangdongensis]|uniref:RING-type E3 ubiquitin transferase n=1 Tax=Platanthera guangdongensis TaxID=2320717 RepID=A0ABR2LGN3_9ASPA
MEEIADNPALAAAVPRLEEEEDEGDVCRICRNPGEEDNPLRYPCACSGSIKFVHQDCLLQWLNHSNARQCEVCKHVFSFSPLYAENAPSRLPFREFLIGMTMKACHVLQFFLRLAFVLSVWLLIIPFITFWLWRLMFVRSFGEAQRLFLGHLSAPLILTDCLHGFLLSASIVFIFLGATSLRDYFRHLRELGGHDGDDEGQERQGVRAARRAAGPANRALAIEANAEDGAGAPGIAGAGQIIRRNAENVAARLEMQAARLEAHVEQMFDGLDDADGAEDVPFDELVGMQGPVFHLVENAITVLASNAIFLGVVVFIPFSLGRIVLCNLSWIFSSPSSPMLSTVIPLTESALSLANITLKNALATVNNLSESSNDGVLSQVIEAFVGSSKLNGTGMNQLSNSISSSTSLTGTITSSSRLSDVTTLAFGYMFLFCLIFCYLGLFTLIRYTQGEQLTIGRLYGISSIAEAIPSLFRQFLSGMRHLMTMVKVAFLLVIELGVFPLMCGWWLDVCTLKMLGTTFAKRVDFFSLSPFASSIIHWLVGIIYMLQISIFVSLLRGVLRNGVLYFLRDPADPNYNPFRDLIDDPVHKHARRVLLSVAVYGSLIVMLVFLPVNLAMRLAPSIFPLDISIFDPFIEIPTDIMMFQICIPFALQHFRPRATVKAVLRRWFTAVGWALGLTDFLLPRPEENGRQENGNVEVLRRERLHDARQVLGPHRPPLPQIIAAENHDRRVQAIGHTDGDEESDVDDQSDSKYGFVLRIVLLLILAWRTLLLFNAALVVLPISVGRAVFNSIPRFPFTHGIKCNDLVAFSIDLASSGPLWLGPAIQLNISDLGVPFLHVPDFQMVHHYLEKLCLLSLWIVVIPVLIGLLFELLVLVPLRVPVDESPVFLLYQDWAVGLIIMKSGLNCIRWTTWHPWWMRAGGQSSRE